MTIQNIAIPYSDFKLQEIIDPEQFDLNNATMVTKINQLLGLVNNLTDGSETDIGGSDLVSVRTIAPFTSTNLQALLSEITSYLKSTNGAGYIGVSPITGLSGTTIQAFFASVKGLHDTLDAYTKVLQAEIDANELSLTNLNTKFIETDGNANLALAKALGAHNQSTTALALSTQKAEEMDVLMASVSDLMLYINQTFLVDVTNTLAEYDARIEDAEVLGASVVATANTALTQSDTALTQSASAVTKADGSVATVNGMVATVNTATTNANSATASSITATNDSKTATSLAVTATTNANVATNSANVARADTQTATNNAISATNSANASAVSANTQGNFAQTQGAFAQTEANRAKTQATLLEGKQANVDKAIADSGIAITKSTIAETNSATAITTANLAQARADNVIASSGTSSTEQVDSRLGADLVARVTSGTLIREIHTQQLETARSTTTLGNGVAVVSGGVDALAETEVEGRTLINVSNSNFEAGKQYVLANKGTKVIVDGITQSGVAKFTKGTTTVSTANYLNKVAGSAVANPHIVKTNPWTSLREPSSVNFTEQAGSVITSISALGGNLWTTDTTIDGYIRQSLFSFDVIAEIERKLGIIPKSTLAEKVLWVKDNVESLVANWHGFGSSVGGNKATLARWGVVSGVWGFLQTHTGGSVTKLSITENVNIPSTVDANGQYHLLAYADASDGITASSISTDYIDLVVTLKPTAQLITRPTIIRVENFEGKVNGSVVENPHVMKYAHLYTTLMLPSSSTNIFELNASASHYPAVGKLDNTTFLNTYTGSGQISQHLFSFNLIEAIERNVGKIPRTSVADKVQWIKENMARFTFNAHAFGSSLVGNRALLAIWYPPNSSWSSFYQTISISSVVSKITNMQTNPLAVDVNGFIHALLFADASDGVTASTINTDYIDLEIELKPTADFTRPKVALYEVTADSYAKILVDWSADEVVNRYPSVEGVQHLQGVGVIAEGENLLPPFTEWALHANAKVISPYELELNATGSAQTSEVVVNVLANREYYLETVRHIYSGDSRVAGYFYDVSGNQLGVYNNFLVTNVGGFFTTPANAKTLKLRVVNLPTSAGTYTFKNPMLTLGNVAKPFVPRNPSYLIADVKLGAIGTVADRLYELDGQRFVRKVVEKDVVLGGDLGWLFAEDRGGYKIVIIAQAKDGITLTQILTKYNGYKVPNVVQNIASVTKSDENYLSPANAYSLGISIADSDTGFGEAYTPSVAEMKAYFYGYKMNNGAFGTNYDGTGTKTWIPISDTSNARAVTVVPTSASPTQLDGTIQPYKLSYVLATPQIVNVTDKVEGSLKVNGLTQVEVLSGIVRREKVVPGLNNGVYRINSWVGANIAPLKNKADRVLTVYKNGIVDNTWVIQDKVVNNGNLGDARADIKPEYFDATAEYTVTYIALDKHLLTANPTNIKLLYANNMRSSLEDTVTKVSDNTTQLSVHEKAIVDLYIRVKALGG